MGSPGGNPGHLARMNVSVDELVQREYPPADLVGHHDHQLPDPFVKNVGAGQVRGLALGWSWILCF